MTGGTVRLVIFLTACLLCFMVEYRYAGAVALRRLRTPLPGNGG